MKKNVTKLIFERVLCTSITNRVFSWFDRFCGLLYGMSKNVTKLISHEFCAQVSQIVLLDDLTVFRPSTTVWAKLRFLWTNVTNRVFSWFDRFCGLLYGMSKNVTKLISPRFLCTSITNRVLSWFDSFTTLYNCMKENVTKLIYARVHCTSITKRVLSWFDRFSA